MENHPTTFSNSHLSCGELLLDLEAKAVFLARAAVALTPLEFKLLVYLAHRQTRPVSVEELLETVWKCTDGGTANQVICSVKRLRKKLAVDGMPQYLHTHRGFGFRLCEPGKIPPPPDGKGDEADMTLF
jgi:two-component system alkaline phosphatase synthesis response regulator PhoP